jgi:protein-tyrosine phosphatase
MIENYPASILFVCTGNTCRSPMAEYLMREKSKERGEEIITASRGIGVSEETPEISAEACTVVGQLYPRTKIKGHIPQDLNETDILNYELILTMSDSHRTSIIRRYRPGLESERKIFTLKEYAALTNGVPSTYSISDPFGAGVWSLKYLSEQRLLHLLSPQAYRFKENKETWVIDPVVKLRAYTKCRDDIILCLDRILDGNITNLDKVIADRRIKRIFESKYRRGIAIRREK